LTTDLHCREIHQSFAFPAKAVSCLQGIAVHVDLAATQEGLACAADPVEAKISRSARRRNAPRGGAKFSAKNSVFIRVNAKNFEQRRKSVGPFVDGSTIVRVAKFCSNETDGTITAMRVLDRCGAAGSHNIRQGVEP
jgi:hypothetical protein